jgi:AcrR family transcriptional regulator
MDRRILRTRQSLQEALMMLLRQKPLEEIEIQEITEQANTARVTFYRHYGTREELLLDAIESIYQEIQTRLPVVSVEHVLDFRQPPPGQILFEFLEADRALYKKLFTGSVCALIQQRLRHYIVQQVTLTFSTSPHYADLPVGLVANHIASTMIGNMMWWLAEDVPYSAAYMARLTHWTALAGVMTVIGRGAELTLPPPEIWRLPE